MSILNIFRSFVGRLAAIPKLLRDKNAAFWKKGIIIISIVYLISPIEILPDFLLPVGFIDDLAVWSAIIVGLGNSLDEYRFKTEGQDLSKKYRKKTVINDVEFEVDPDENGEKYNKPNQ